jgi:hypothetical protein
LKKIRTGRWSEQLLNDGFGMAVACYDGWLRRYDTLNFEILDSIKLKAGLQWLQKDRLGRVWALSTDSNRSELFRVLPADKMVKAISFSKEHSASRLCVSKGGDTLFCLAGGLVALPMESDFIPEPIFKQSGANFYGLQCDPFSGLLYISDAGDYVSRSTVYQIDSRGNQYSSFKAGIITGGFLIYR